jgi:hypothetical protein
MGLSSQSRAPAALRPGKNRYSWYRGLGGSQGRSGRVQKISPLLLWYITLTNLKTVPLAIKKVLVSSTHVTYFGHYKPSSDTKPMLFNP